MIEGPIQDAYMTAVYSVTSAGETRAFSFRARPGDRPSPLKLPSPWAIITAHNPMSVRLGEAANTRRAAELMETLHARRLASEPAENSALDGSWREPGRVVFGIARQEALELGRCFGQHAIVWSEGGRVGMLDCRTERWVVRPTYPQSGPEPGG